jgi:hypothetical protein
MVLKRRTDMKLLKDTCLYAIKVDYFMWNEETDEEYTKPMYLSINTETKRKDGTPANLIIFKEEITENLRVFDEKSDAVTYMINKSRNACSFENARVIKITYDFETGNWKEC